MYNNEIIRAWKDEDYFDNLNEEQRSLLPDNPVGIVELSDDDMEIVTGGRYDRSHIRGGGCGNSDLTFNIYGGTVIVSIADNSSSCNIYFGEGEG